MQITADAPPEGTAPVVRPARFTERGPLFDWLDDGLRGGRRGRLVAEYGAALVEPDAVHSAVATVSGRFVAHALARRVRVRARGVRARIGLVGLVYTDPAWRRRGLAARCIRACEGWLEGQGVEIAVLWSDRHDWYERLGWNLAGVERMFRLDAATCARATRSHPFAGEVAPPRAADWPTLERLHDAHASRSERRPGLLEALAAGPDCRVVVARLGETPVAWAALGRGDDFTGVIHEWAGSIEGVLACAARLRQPHDTVSFLAGPSDEACAAVWSEAGAPERRGGFGLVRMIEPGPLWSRLTPWPPAARATGLERRAQGFRFTGAAGRCELDGRSVARLLLDEGGVDTVDAALSPSQRRSLSRILPWPLFVRGFDSI